MFWLVFFLLVWIALSVVARRLRLSGILSVGVLTLNRLDFFRLHRSTIGNHARIIACTRDDENPAQFANRIHAAIVPLSTLSGQLVRVVLPSS
jgi:hypothetical protein